MARTQLLPNSTQQAFVQEIYQKHHTDLLMYARGKIQNTLEGEEIIQMFYLKLMDKHIMIADQYEKIGTRYLKRIISNLCNDRFKVKKKRREIISIDDGGFEIEIDGSNYCPTIIYERYHDELESLLTKLEHHLLEMKIQGYSHQDIAEKLEISISNVSVILFRLRNKIGIHFER